MWEESAIRQSAGALIGPSEPTTTSKPTVDLPQELIEEILSYVLLGSLDWTQSFLNCSLISKSWLEPSRRTLYAYVLVSSETYERFTNSISPKNTGILHKIRSFACYSNGVSPFLLKDYLRSLCYLRTLYFCYTSLKLNVPNNLQFFSAFQHTLCSLRFVKVTVPWSVFVALVGYFPNLTDLDIHYTSFTMNRWSVLRPSRPPHGKLALWIGTMKRRDMRTLVSRLPELNPEYSELVVDGSSEDISPILAVVQKNLRSLSVYSYRTSDYLPPLDLSRCRKLEEINIFIRPRHQEAIPVSSITSTKFRRIVFVISSSGWNKMWRDIFAMPCWSQLDDMLVKVVDRLRLGRYEHTLEVEVQVDGACDSREGVDDQEFLPRFREKGKVTILDGQT